MTFSPELAQGHRDTAHQCKPTRGAEKCSRVEWHFLEMRGLGDFARCTWSVSLHANFSDSEGWEWQRELASMTLVASVSEVHGMVRGMLHDGGLFNSADDVHVWAVRVD